MAVKSLFDIRCFKDVKFQFYTELYRNPKTFFKISFPPVCQQKLLHVYVLPYFTHCMEVACWHKGGGGGKDVQQPKNPGPKPIKCLFYQIRN